MAAETEKELQQLKKRFMELAEKSWQRNQYFFTGFLNMAELDVFYRAAQSFSHVPWEVCGGGPDCERQMVRFGSKELFGYEEPFPIVCLHITPLMEKFADALSHRDFLGACMNLGIDRSTMGDILLQKKSAYLYCTESIAPYIMENLIRVKHTVVSCIQCEGASRTAPAELREKEFQASSERMDGVVAKVFSLSRGESLLLFLEKKVFVNGRLCENNSSVLKKEDVVTVRGYGKFVYGGVERMTKKGRLQIKVQIYGS